MRFEWDKEKNRINRRKHGVDFEEAQTVFDDPLAVAMRNNKNKKTEMRHEYDFSGGERGKFFHVPESQRMIPLDVDIIRYFQRRGRKEKKAYYVLINETLRRTMNYEKPAAGIAELLQEMIAKEVQKQTIEK